MSTYLALYQIYAMACATARFGKTYGALLFPAGRRQCAIRQRPALRILYELPSIFRLPTGGFYAACFS
jgi:hypothetical protein